MICKRYFFEIWKDIYEYEGLYQISNYGRVKSVKRKVIRGNGREQLVKERLLKQAEKKNGYLYVVLYKEGKMKHYLVHQLVAKHFIPNPNNYKEVNHKNENKKLNVVWNLEWVSHKYNINYGTCIERMAKTLTNGKLSKAVLQINKETREVIKEFPSTHQVERELGFANTSISACCLGKYKSAYGYIWRYKNAS